jgi:DNA-binding CsgD family transcriptional regulator/PAS domain-containing protein
LYYTLNNNNDPKGITLIHLDIQQADLDSVLTLCNSFKLATVCLSLDKFIIDVNPCAEMLFSHSLVQLRDKAFHTVCLELGIEPPIDLSVTPETLITSSAPTEHWLANHTLTHVHWTVSRCLDENGYSGYLLVGKIIQCLDNPRNQMENMLRALPCAVFSKDLNSCCVTVNQYQADMAGFASGKEMIGKNDYDMPWADVADIIQKADKMVLKENKTIVLEECVTLADGSQGTFLVTKSPFKDEFGKLLGIVGTSMSVKYKMPPLANDSSFSFEYLNKNPSKTYLSKKEIECVNWLIKGKSSSEIAAILHISKRTVEAHMNNVKTKLKCYKQFQVGYLVGRYGYLLL